MTGAARPARRPPESEPTSVSDLVPSPLWHALHQLHTDVQRDLAVVGGALDDADRRMAGGKGQVWVGPAAERWGAELSGVAQDVGRRARAFAACVERELGRRPRQVPAAEAAAERRRLDLRPGR